MAMIGGNQFIRQRDVIDFSRLREGDVVADLGCGSGGYFVIEFAEFVGPTGKVYAVDVLPEALQTVENAARRTNMTNIITLHSNLEIPGITKIPKGSLDGAYLINMLFQNKKKEIILNEADSFVKRGGVLTVVDWRRSAQGFGPTPELLVDRQMIADVLADRYDLMVSETLGEYHFIDVYKKR